MARRQAGSPAPSSVPPSVSDPSVGRSSASAAPTRSQSSPTKSRTTNSSAASQTSLRNAHDAQGIVLGVWRKYLHDTPQRTKLIDVFLAFLVVVGALQFLYCVVAGNYPFNAFLSGFGATLGQFVLTASLRMQTNPQNQVEFKSLSHERAFADYVFGSLILHFFCINFIN